ncbi:radical SAM protein [Methanocella sp. CWC-04]|uniref:Radical SAM protein n=1 Tax=Methanooceanicella nereidis TaxID=2052831 RepID=A0AAP2RBP0_9EURY|nr:radical SAM protein [Methanocella sp. CWC-04]
MSDTKSLCPECLAVVDAEILDDGTKVILSKECKAHGVFSDIYYSDSRIYGRFLNYRAIGNGLSDPMTTISRGCPYDCGICPGHRSHTLLANIDVTNRCNLSCPICFANAKKSGYVYEPSFEEIRHMMTVLRNEKPVPCYAVQFAGGEPTMREDLPEIIKMAKEMGFIQIQIATNGVKLAASKDYCRELRKSPLSTVYLQFDGVTEEPYVRARGFNALPLKLKAISNMRETGLDNIVLVPTLVKDVNSGQVGDIVRFAIENLDVVRGVNFQPVSFTGRIESSELQRQRITIPDFMGLLEDQTSGEITKDDFYPVPCVTPISDLAETWSHESQVRFTVHPHCGCGTYVFIEGNKMIPVTRFVDVSGLLNTLESISIEFKNSRFSKVMVTERLLKEVPKYVDREKMPGNLDYHGIIRSFIRGRSIDALCQFHDNALFIGAMHFQDPYNIDLERLRSCGIHYALPDGRVIPFCSYNMLYREALEKKFSRPSEEHK